MACGNTAPVRAEADLGRCVNYIHYTPVKHGWVQRMREWPHSTFHRYVRMEYPVD